MIANSRSHQTFLGFDFGEKRIGIAVGQQVTRSATALTTVHARNDKPDWDTIARLIEEWKPDALVVGIPYHMDGSEQEMTRRAQRFCRQLAGRFQLPVFEAEERLSSYIVEQDAADTGKAQEIDPLAARVILQDWLQNKEPQT